MRRPLSGSIRGYAVDQASIQSRKKASLASLSAVISLPATWVPPTVPIFTAPGRAVPAGAVTT